MCGIAGAIGPDGLDPGVLTRMGDALKHRGPDGEGYLLASPGEAPLRRLPRERLTRRDGPAVGFAHRRLTILDLSERSDQPLVDNSGDFAVAYNGELYNYLELRQELEGVGHTFQSDGDTEVVLTAYKQWGAECVRRFVGMWAMAILDAPGRRLFLSRDRFGIKPLHYARVGDKLYFASEIKALQEVPGIALEPDEEVVRRFLLTGVTDSTDRTFFKGIRRLPPAHNMILDLDGRPEPGPATYWSYPPQDGPVSEPEAVEGLRELLQDSVRIHARSDVPVGTCLSGGLDSTTIVCLAEELRARGEIPQYTHSAFGYLPHDETLSERGHMESVLRMTGARMHFVETSTERFVDQLPSIIRQQDEPFGSTSIAAQWFVFEEARRQRMKVMLDGQGADEVLGGYHGYFPVIASGLLHRRRFLSYARFHREHRALLGRSPLAPSRAAFNALPKPVRHGLVRRRGLPPPPAARLLSPGMRELASAEDGSHPPDSLDELLRAETRSTGLPALLRYEDRNSMAHSIEARVPFLDHRLVEFAFRLPDDLKIRGVETKHVLREAMRDLIPEDVRVRKDKVGFRAEPRAAWILAARHRESLLAAHTEYEQRWFDPDAVAGALDGSDRSADSEFMLWRMINTKLWLRLHWSGREPLSTS